MREGKAELLDTNSRWEMQEELGCYSERRNRDDIQRPHHVTIYLSDYSKKYIVKYTGYDTMIGYTSNIPLKGIRTVYGNRIYKDAHSCT